VNAACAQLFRYGSTAELMEAVRANRMCLLFNHIVIEDFRAAHPLYFKMLTADPSEPFALQYPARIILKTGMQYAVTIIISKHVFAAMILLDFL